jgi:hypothetical protein
VLPVQNIPHQSKCTSCYWPICGISSNTEVECPLRPSETTCLYFLECSWLFDIKSVSISYDICYLKSNGL